jgi:diaminopimelate epimerase
MKTEKFTATGNSFIVCDLTNNYLTDKEKSKFVVENSQERDGVIFVERKNNEYFMDYYNKDGKRAAFCGNGARTFLYYLKIKGYVQDDLVKFNTYAGEVYGKLTENGVMIKMPTPSSPKKFFIDNFEGFFLTVGVPHFVVFVDDVNSINVNTIGKYLRDKLNSNINFVQIINESTLKIRTFERGVEAETLACGSGTTASAFVFNNSNKEKIEVRARGGILYVHFLKDGIYLEGGVQNV